MKIAITADNHLTSNARNPERFQTLAALLEECGALEVQLLIIAGDLFDQSLVNYAEFEALYKASRPKDLTTVVIPGNHDQNLQKSALAAEGLQIYAKPTLRPLNDSRSILFLPYQENLTMGEAIAPFADQLLGTRWILVGHGDWSAGQNSPDPYEPGVYMPLTAADLARYQPEVAFLGHIHLPQENSRVYYPGSPCPLNISETGLRRFLVFDTAAGTIESHPVDTPLLYFDESFLMVPAEKDLEILEKDIRQRLDAWNLPAGWADRVRVRLQVAGTARADRAAIIAVVQDLFSPFQPYQGLDPDLTDLIQSQDPDREEIALQMRDWIAQLDWESSPILPDKSLILEKALRFIYGADR